jgi:hypothetical protein
LFEADAQVHGDGNLTINQLPGTMGNCRWWEGKSRDMGPYPDRYDRKPL